MEKEKRETKVSIVGGLVFVGSLMIGLALGIFYDIVAVGTLMGLGVGFVLFGLVWAFTK